MVSAHSRPRVGDQGTQTGSISDMGWIKYRL